MRTVLAIIALTAAVSAQALREFPTVNEVEKYVSDNGRVTIGQINFSGLVIPDGKQRVRVVSDKVIADIKTAERIKTEDEIKTEYNLKPVSEINEKRITDIRDDGGGLR